MPFRKSAKITMENIDEETMTLYYQIDYTLTEVPADAAYFHAQFRRTNPLPYKIRLHHPRRRERLGPIRGHLHGLGRAQQRLVGRRRNQVLHRRRRQVPHHRGTGTEDYFCGSYDFDSGPPKARHQYTEFTTPYSGLAQVLRPDGHYEANTRFGLYRWHIMDPIRFEQDLKVTIQALGWRSGGRYLPLQDDIASVAFWYQTEPHAPFPKLPDKDYLEIK